MPNNIMCKYSYTNRATHEFYECSDGNRYINPEYYKKMKIKNE